MNRIEEKLYTEIVLTCESDSCGELYLSDVDANDPMTEWSKRNSVIALDNGWAITKENKVLCPKCVKGVHYAFR